MTVRTEPRISLEVVPVRRITHITAGNPDWVPTDGQLTRLVEDFQKAELGNGIFATRTGVRIHNVVVEVPDATVRAEQAVIKAALLFVDSPSDESKSGLAEATKALSKLRLVSVVSSTA